MKKINIKIVNLTLSAAILFSSTSCKLQKNNELIVNGSIVDFDNEKYNNISDQHVKEIIADLINKMEEKNYDVSLDKLIDRLSKTTFIKNKPNEFTLGTYNDEDCIFTYVENDDETIRHELIHMMLPDYPNSSIAEGLTQIFLNELYGYEIDTNIFDACLCKVLCRILDKEELSKFINGDIDVLKNRLASIKPAYDDANDFLIFANNGEYYFRLYCESDFNNELDEFRNKEEYGWLKEYRRVTKNRLKLYLKEYYNNVNFDVDPYDRLVEIFEVLNIVNYFMYNESLGEVNEMDYFLESAVNNIIEFYDLDSTVVKAADDKAKECLSFKYLDKIINTNNLDKNK